MGSMPASLVWILLSATLILGACASNTNSNSTLYEAMGAQAGIKQLSENLIREIASDDRLRPIYKDTDIARFNEKMQELFCATSGGGCTYSGDNMRRTHAGMKVSATEFNLLVEAMMRAMNTSELPVGVQNRILAIYAPMRTDIVETNSRLP